MDSEQDLWSWERSLRLSRSLQLPQTYRGVCVCVCVHTFTHGSLHAHEHAHTCTQQRVRPRVCGAVKRAASVPGNGERPGHGLGPAAPSPGHVSAGVQVAPRGRAGSAHTPGVSRGNWHRIHTLPGAPTEGTPPPSWN